jgi:hypothetical protein
VSHQPERKEKNCLNCGATVIGRYCHICGQENIQTKQGFWSLTKHFVFDIFHFDGKFFETLGHLLFRPGIISKEYVEGKRSKYLDPIRMYLFTSAVFFLAFFALEKIKVTGFQESQSTLNKSQRMEVIYDLNNQLKSTPNDTFLKKQLSLLADSTYSLRLDSSRLGIAPTDSIIDLKGKRYELMATPYKPYDKFKLSKRDDVVSRKIQKKAEELNARYGENLSENMLKFFEGFFHKFPYLLFVSLPIFAGILKLLYIRRKDLYYSDHAVFTLYHYILSFILILIVIVLSKLESLIGGEGFFRILITLIFCIWPVYLYIEMKRFYGQGWLKTLGKFLLLDILGALILLVLMLGFLVFSVFQM